MTEQFAKRKINVRILANKGTSSEEEILLEGLKCSCHTAIYTGYVQGEMHLNIWGMSLETMDKLTTFGPIMQERRHNEITVTAGEEGKLMPTVYIGAISRAFADMNSAPDVRFSIFANSADQDQVNIVPEKDHKGGIDVALVVADLAKEMNKTFQNHGVSFILKDRFYYGTALMQMRECARDANINFSIERNILSIWPKDGYKKGTAIEISPTTGMVGYPTFSGQGVFCTTLYNPEIELGRPVKVISSMKVACGIWNPVGVWHLLETETPQGAWFTQVATYGKGVFPQ